MPPEPTIAPIPPRRQHAALAGPLGAAGGLGPLLAELGLSFLDLAEHLVHLLPLGALFYLAGLPLIFRGFPLYGAPALAYLASDAVACLEILARGGGARQASLAFFLFPLRHLAYGWGLLAGLAGGSREGAAMGTIRIVRRR